jgi:hypothetical protein
MKTVVKRIAMRSVLSDALAPFIITVAVLCMPGQAQEPATAPDTTFNADTRVKVAEKFAQVLADEYAYEEAGAKMAAAIRTKLEAGTYDSITSPAQFARALQDDARAVTHDLHLGVGFGPGPKLRMQTRRGPLSPAMAAQIEREAARQNGGIFEVRILDGNIGYLPVSAMVSQVQAAKDAIAAAFAFLHNTDALILDLRGNPGGSGYAETFLSYLSEGPPYVTSTIHWRKDNRTQVFKTTDMGAASYGVKKPVFVLTSRRTFSAAEGLAYEIQIFKRGVIVGETTRGGANPFSGGGTTSLGHGFSARVPMGHVVSAITGTNWEGEGVKPDIIAPAEQALAKAWSLAAARLMEMAPDQQTHQCLEGLTLAKLDGTPSLAPTKLTGNYATSDGRVLVIGPIASRIAIVERGGKLYWQNRIGDKDDEAVLQPIGGDRYRPAEIAGGCSLTFFRRGEKIELLQVAPMASLVLDKQESEQNNGMQQ